MLENELLRDGNYGVVTSGLQFYDGSDMSRALPDVHPTTLAELGGISEGRVWQFPFKNFIYESGLILNDAPVLRNFPLATRISGVYVDGRFCPTDPLAPGYDATCSHTIDYLNGRIIFDNALSLGTNVHADYSYKEVSVHLASKFNDQLVEGVLQTKFLTNPRTSNQLVYPSGASKLCPFPAIFIEDINRTWTNYQLGDRSLVAHDEVLFTIYALDHMSRDNLIDLISLQERKPFLLIDFNVAPFPLSGITNTLSLDYIPYVRQVLNPVVNAQGDTSIGYKGWIENTRITNLESFRQEINGEIFEIAEVRADITLYTIAPSTPIGILMNPTYPKC